MHGKYTSSLRDFAQDYARKLKLKVEEDEISGAEHADDFRSYSGESETCWSIKCMFQILFDATRYHTPLEEWLLYLSIQEHNHSAAYPFNKLEMLAQAYFLLCLQTSLCSSS